jgi:hypothetical protein
MSMQSKSVQSLAGGMLATAALGLAMQTAHAVSATWELKGTITTATLAPGPDAPTINVGTPFRLLVTFETDAPFSIRNSSVDPVTGLPRPGLRYQYFGTPLRFALYTGSCDPCTPEAAPERNGIFVRDGFADPLRNPPPDVPYDGYTFFMDPTADDQYGWQVIFRDQDTNFTPQIVDVTGPTPVPLPYLPDDRLTQMAESSFTISNNSNGDIVQGRIESVTIPTYGTAYVITGRDCSYPDFRLDRLYDECTSSGVPGFFNRYIEEGGGAGQGDFSRTVNIEFPAFTNTPPAPLLPLGTVFGSATFGGPAALPVVKASSYPTDIARTNGNVQAYQQYRYKGAVRTAMPLVGDLTYQVRDNLVIPSNSNPFITDTSTYPGVGRVTGTVAIINGDIVDPADMAAAGFGHRRCGSEGEIDPFTGKLAFPKADGSQLPAGTIMGTATFQNGPGESGPQARVINVVRCAGAGETANSDGTVASGEPISLAPNQLFYVVTTLQTPARGKWQQAINTSTAPSENGYADAASTFRVTIDPAAPPEVIQDFFASVAPECTDCTFEPDYRIDVMPGSSDNSINPGRTGVIPVAILAGGSASIYDIDVPTLKLGDLKPRANKAGKQSCSYTDIDLDGTPDLICQFENAAANWSADQTAVLLTGQLKNGASVVASDSVRIVR